ncbi:hypothetical protein [Mycolicibacterium sphagni]|uniref:hypothetical protein n=1 Tax=Mycolicibacterium sphagni TaxID=1786 RepID=UPI0021F3B31E|nr:hypothetical protein [Mycolicibacterium sphagni]MCV7174883.1 hypothetical protein [Mycolicibacterium sphagni]
MGDLASKAPGYRRAQERHLVSEFMHIQDRGAVAGCVKLRYIDRGIGHDSVIFTHSDRKLVLMVHYRSSYVSAADVYRNVRFGDELRAGTITSETAADAAALRNEPPVLDVLTGVDVFDQVCTVMGISAERAQRPRRPWDRP